MRRSLFISKTTSCRCCFIDNNKNSSVNSSSLSSQLTQLFRHQGWSGHISGSTNLHQNSIKQSDGVDDVVRVKAEQQRWLDVEQWSGYSDSYLKQNARFRPQYEVPGSSAQAAETNWIQEISEIVYDIYGEAADILEELESNPLHPQFKEMLETARTRRKHLEQKLDEIYAGAHPTIKTMYDAMLVRRWQTLEDWMELVQRNRQETINKLTPEWIEELEKRKGIAEEFKTKLKHLGMAMEASPVAFLEGSGFSEEEMAMIERRKRFFRRSTEFGKAINQGDYNPH
jgi:hypothetical protein